MCFVFSACGIQKDVGIASITINSESSVIEIYEGEFDEANITATILYKNNTTETVTITADMVAHKTIGDKTWYKVPGTYAITILINGETVDATVKVLPKYITVRFFDGNRALIKQESIRKGTDATAPNDGFGMAGMQFIGWDRLLTNLTEDTDVYAVYGNITALDIESELQESWHYALEHDGSSSNTSVYNMYKFDDGKVYCYNGKLETFLYTDESVIQGVEYTAIYKSEVRNEVHGVWEISFTNNTTNHKVYFDGEELYTKKESTITNYQQLSVKYALQNDVWYQWNISLGENNIDVINGYVKIASNSKIGYYRGNSVPTNDTEVTYLSYSMFVNDMGEIGIKTEETSSVQSLTIVCSMRPYVSNFDSYLTIAQ